MIFGDTQKLKVFAFGPFRLIPDLGLLVRDGKRVDVPQKPFEILLTLAQAEGRALSKSEILDCVWGDQEVEENCLQGHMTVLRKALGADRNAIKTEFGFGYRLLARQLELGELASENRFAALPTSRSSFVGRVEESEAVRSLLNEASLVTVTGTGGIGKSRLALEIAASLEDTFADGVCLIELAPVTDQSLVLHTVGSALHLDLHTERMTESRVRDWSALIVLDNCEHVLDAVCDAVKIISKQIPKAKIVCTSQEPLGISGEQIFRLQPLAAPSDDLPLLSGALLYPAVELLAARIGAADQRLTLTDAEAANLCRVCRQLDGIPLAIELAAARVPLLGLSAVIAGLSDRFRLLSGGRRADLPRHRTLKATLEWSVGLLSEAEQIYLSRLSVFAGQFTLEAAEFVVALDKSNLGINELMASLVSKSLVSVERPDGEARFRLSESMRLFLFEKFVASDEFSVSAALHAKFFQSRLLAAASDWRSVYSDAWMQKYRDDLGDVRAALDWVFSSKTDPEQAAAILCTSLPFWMQLSLLDECGKRVVDCLDRFKASGELQPHLEMQLLAALGASITWVDGPTPKAKGAWSRTLKLAERLDDNEFRLQGHYGLWLYHLRAGDYRVALQHAEAIEAAGTTCDDKQAVYAGRRTIGVTLHFMGQHDRGAKIIDAILATPDDFRQSLPLRFAVDQRVAALAFRSRIYWIQGNEKMAFTVALQSIDEARSLEHGSSLCCALLEGACTVAGFARRPDILKTYAEEALQLAERYKLGFWARYAKAFIALSDVFSEKSPAAMAQLHRAVATLDTTNLHSGYPYFHLVLAEFEAEARSDQRIESFVKRVASQPHWAGPEAMRIHSTLMSAALRSRKLLDAEQAAKEAGAAGWLSRIRSDLAVSDVINFEI